MSSTFACSAFPVIKQYMFKLYTIIIFNIYIYKQHRLRAQYIYVSVCSHAHIQYL